MTERTQNADFRRKPQIFAENRRFSQIRPFSWVGNGPNTVSGVLFQTPNSLSFVWGSLSSEELSELLPAYYLCAKANSPSFPQNSPSLPRNTVRLSEFSSPKQYSRNSIPPVSYSNWKFRHLEGAGNRRKPQIFAGN